MMLVYKVNNVYCLGRQVDVMGSSQCMKSKSHLAFILTGHVSLQIILNYSVIYLLYKLMFITDF